MARERESIIYYLFCQKRIFEVPYSAPACPKSLGLYLNLILHKLEIGDWHVYIIWATAFSLKGGHCRSWGKINPVTTERNQYFNNRKLISSRANNKYKSFHLRT